MKKHALPKPSTPQKGQGVPSNKPPPVERAKSDLTTFKKPAPIQTILEKPLSKTYLSKSHDNLAFTLRRRANLGLGSQKPRPQSSLGLPKPDDPLISGIKRSMNKENLKTGSPAKQQKLKVGPTTLHKAHSTQNIDRISTPTKIPLKTTRIKKASSTQQLDKDPVVIKRAQSTQNLSKDRGTRNRISAPANVMAYNAELLANFEKEKRILESRISELIQIAENRKAEIEKNKIEVKRLKEQVSSKNVKEQLELLHSENRLLKDRLHELGISVEQITDSEKLSMLKKSPSIQKHLGGQGEGACKDDACGGTPLFSSTLKSDSVDNLAEATAGESEPAHSVDLTCNTPDHASCLSMVENSNWESRSNKSDAALSEMSVVCLQDRILQMEETHYSTNEELQATLQELGDLQDAVNELTYDNQRFCDEKAVLLESLCTQTEKLENCRTQIEHLKALLLTDQDNVDRSDREVQLVSLLKGAQEEREELFLKQAELMNNMQTYENENKEMHDIVTALRDKIHIAEDKVESLQADKQELEKENMELKERFDNDQIEISRYKTLLDNEKSKLAELEQARKAADRSDLEELLDNTRQEKDKVETELANTQEALAHRQNDVTKLKETIATLEEEIASLKHNRQSQAADLVDKLQAVENEKVELQQECDTLRDHIDQLEQDCDRYLQAKKTYNATLSDMEAELKAAKMRNAELRREVKELSDLRENDQRDWQQFQSDLQTAVVIANDIKTETQEEHEKMTQENETLKDQVKTLQETVKNLQEEQERFGKPGSSRIFTSSELKSRMMSSVDRELTVLRSGQRRHSSSKEGQQNLSVKNLIRSIEDQVKGGGQSKSSSQNSSRRGSMDSSTSSSLSPKTEAIKSPSVDLRRTSSPASTGISILKKTPEPTKDRKTPIHRHSVASVIYENSRTPVTDDAKSKPSTSTRSETDGPKHNPAITSILSTNHRRNSISGQESSKDPLVGLVKATGGSKRNALLKFCQQRMSIYPGVDITNFSSSWNDGLAFCALIHSYLPDKIPFNELNSHDKKRNFTLAFKTAEKVGIPSSLNINDMVTIERPDWMAVMAYVTAIYKHFEA